jgi:hypothetical protein
MDDLLAVTEGTKARYGSGKGFAAPAGLDRILWSPSGARWPWRGFPAGHPFVLRSWPGGRPKYVLLSYR